MYSFVAVVASVATYTSLKIASVDYANTTADLRFGPSSRMRSRCVLIPVINDMVPEVPEQFSVVLAMATPLPNVALTPNSTTVAIHDDDGKCYVLIAFRIGSLMLASVYLQWHQSQRLAAPSNCLC